MARADFFARRHQVRCRRENYSARPSSEQRVELGDDVEWAVVNAGGHGFYRVRYGGDLARRAASKDCKAGFPPWNDSVW